MKTITHPLLFLVISGLGLYALPLPPAAYADDDDVEIEFKDDKIEVETDRGKAEIEKDGEVDVEGPGGARALAIAREALSEKQAAEFSDALVKGYVVPVERRVYLNAVPQAMLSDLPPLSATVVYRSFGNTVYAIEPETYRVVDVIRKDIHGNPIAITRTAVKTDSEAWPVMRVGYVVPRDRYAMLETVPSTIITSIPEPPSGAVYRYYDGTVYAINPGSRVVVDVIEVR